MKGCIWWILISRRFRICWQRGVELRPPKVDPYFKSKKEQKASRQKFWLRNKILLRKFSCPLQASQENCLLFIQIFIMHLFVIIFSNQVIESSECSIMYIICHVNDASVEPKLGRKSSDHLFWHSRTTLKKEPPSDSSFWNISNCLLSWFQFVCQGKSE